jgi:hypothetical protein
MELPTPAAILAVGQLGPVKALSKAERLRYHQQIANGFHTLSGEIPAIRAIPGVTLLPYLVPTQPQWGRPFDPARARCRNGKDTEDRPCSSGSCLRRPVRLPTHLRLH